MKRIRFSRSKSLDTKKGESEMTRITGSLSLFCCLFLLFPANAQRLNDSSLSGDRALRTPLPTGFRLEKGMITDENGRGGMLELSPEDIAGFDLSFQITFLTSTLRLPASFTIAAERSYGTWNVILLPDNQGGGTLRCFFQSANKELGNQMYSMGRKVELPTGRPISCRLVADDSRLELHLDGKKHLIGSAPGFGRIQIRNYHLGYELQNLVLNYTPATAEQKILSRNIVPNSSFEYATNHDVPDYWSGTAEVYRSPGVPNRYATAEGRKLLRDSFALHEGKDAPHGSRFLLLTPPAHLISKQLKLLPRKEYVLSAYLKCNQGEKVAFGVTQASVCHPFHVKIHEGNGQWQRVELPFNSRHVTGVSIFAKSEDGKPFAVDAVQLEQGNKISPYQPCFADTGFQLAGDVNADVCANNVNSIAGHLRGKFTITDHSAGITGPELCIADPLTKQYVLTCTLENRSDADASYLLSAVLMEEHGAPILKQQKVSLSAGSKEQIKTQPFHLKNGGKVSMRLSVVRADTLAPCVTLEKMIDAPAVLKCYTEYPFYLPQEKTVRLVAELSPELRNHAANGKIVIRYLVAEDKAYPFTIKSFPVPEGIRAVYELPGNINTCGKPFAYEVQVHSAAGKILQKSTARFFKRNPDESNTAVRINRINRGTYFNGQEFFPSGILVYPDFGSEQLAYYKQCGFDDIMVVTTWSSPQKNKEFMEACLENDLRVFVFHQHRKHSPSHIEILEQFRKYPNFAGMIPNDESSDLSVYETTAHAKEKAPERLIWCNQNFFSYRAFAGRLAPMPGDVLSIDRYPFILQPLCRPQTTRDIYSIDQCLKMLAPDAERERKPVFLWLQSSEKFDKEPTPAQLVYQLYCGIINRAMGFCYFGSLPESDTVWNAMISLNRELKELRPYLFSMEAEPETLISRNPEIRILAKRLKDEIVVIALNFSLQEQTGVIAGMEKSETADVLFENRTVSSDASGVLTDQFAPLARHVYRIKVK